MDIATGITIIYNTTPTWPVLPTPTAALPGSCSIVGQIGLCDATICECGAVLPYTPFVPTAYTPTAVSNNYYQVSTAGNCYFVAGNCHGNEYDRNKFPNFKMFIRNNDADTGRISVAAILIFKRKKKLLIY